MVKPGFFIRRRWCDSAVLILVSFLIAGCVLGSANQQTAAPIGERSAGWYQVYFTDPTAPDAGSSRGGPAAALAAAIDRARLSVDAAFDTLDLWSLRDAMIEAHRRGVTVRVVVESDNLEVEEVRALSEAGSQVLADRREGMMHNKFFILD